MNINTGIEGKETVKVTDANTAVAMGSGDLEVFATPAMIALMEKTAANSVRGELDEGATTVGTLINVAHVAATPKGAEVYCESVLTEVDGRRLVFSVKAYDNAGLIGEGTHERFIVFAEKFMAKTLAKSDK